MYILSLKEIEQVAKGIVKVEDVATPENMALITWSGDDLKQLMDIEIDEGIVNDIKHIMENCGCGDCVTIAIQEYKGRENG